MEIRVPSSSILSKSPGGVKVVIMTSTNEKNGLQLELMANRFGIDDDSATVIKVTRVNEPL